MKPIILKINSCEEWNWSLSNKMLEKDVKKSIPRSMLKFQDPKEWIIFIQSLYQDYKDISLKKMPKNKADRINRTKLRLSELMTNLGRKSKELGC